MLIFIDMNSLSLGQKVRSLRKRANISQLDLEMSIGAAPGSIIRIEKGSVNPTKETIYAIARALQLRPHQTSYLLGINYIEPTATELSRIKDYLSPLLTSQSNYGYLLDSRSCLLELSAGFQNLCHLSGVDPAKLIGHHLVTILFDAQYGVRAAIAPEYFDEVAINELAVVKQEREHLLYEPWWQDLLKSLRSLPDFARLWQEMLSRDINLYSKETRTVYFQIQGQLMPMTYHITNIQFDPRFAYVEYILNIQDPCIL